MTGDLYMCRPSPHIPHCIHGRLSLNHPIKLGGLCTILHGYEVELEITLAIHVAIACRFIIYL